MTNRSRYLYALGAIAIGLLTIPALVAADTAPLKLSAARVTIAGTSNIHPFTASTTDVRMSRLVLAPTDGNRLQAAVTPGAVEAFEIVINAASLTSPKEGLDTKRIHLVLDVSEDRGTIRFRDRCGKSFALYEGAWRLSGSGETTTVRYELSAKPAIAAAQGSAAAGQKVFEAQKCSLCHSVAGKGNAKGPLEGVAKKYSVADLKLWMTQPAEMAKKHNATRKPPMKSFASLPAADVDALVAYLQTLK